MSVAVVVFPGSNCDRDVQRAVAASYDGPIEMVWHQETDFKEKPELIVLPGGFSYGDYLRCGALSAASPIMAAVKKAAQNGTFVVGICNGFQVLTESGLLPGALLANINLQFICSPSYLKVERTDTPFTANYEAGQIVQYPIAHHEGLYFLPPDDLAELEENKQVLFRYASPQTGLAGANEAPNGSLNGIAGILNADGNVLGLMPHPERAVFSHLNGGTDGQAFWQSLLGQILERGQC